MDATMIKRWIRDALRRGDGTGERGTDRQPSRVALAALKGVAPRLGADRGYRPTSGPDSGAAGLACREGATRAAHRLLLEVEALRDAGIGSNRERARALNERGVSTPAGAGA